MSSQQIQRKGNKKQQSVNLQTIRFIKSELKTVEVSKVIERMGYTNRSSFYFHLDENKAEKANREILSLIIDAINEEKKLQQKAEQELKSKIKQSA
jgi:hypothetical protein